MKYDIESILEKYEDDYNPSAMVQGPRNMYNQGQLVQPSSDGSRPGYKGNEITYKGKWEADRYNTVKDINSLKLNKEKVNLKASDFKTGEMRYPDNKGQKYVQQYLDSVQKGYLNNDMSNVTRFKTFIKNKYPKTFAKVIADVNMSGYRGMMDIGVDYKRKLANEIITSSNNQLKYINQFDIIKKLVPANRAAQVKDVGINSLGNLLDEDTLNSFRKLDKMEDKLSKSLTYIVDNDVKILDPSKIKIKGSAAAGYQTQSPIKKMNSVKIKKKGDKIFIKFSSKSFLQNQVRSMVGCLEKVASKKWNLIKFKKVFKSGKRSLCASPAPACGLYLMNVSY